MFNKYFILILIGRLISGVGDAIYYVISYWLIWKLTKSTVILGLTGAVSTLGALAGLFSGVIVDKSNRLLIMIMSDLMRAITVFIIPILIFFHVLQWWIILMVLFTISIMNEFFNPAQQAILSKIVPDNKISSGVGLLFTTEQLSFITGRFLGGLIIVYFSVVWGFITNSVTFLISFVCISLLYIYSILERRQKDFHPYLGEEQAGGNNSYYSSLKEIFIYIRSQSFLFNSILLFFFLMFAYSPMLILLSSWSDNILHKGAMGYSIIQAVFSLGMMIGGLLSPFLQNILRIKYLISIYLFNIFLNIISFAFSRHIIISSLNLILIGISVSLSSTLIMSIQQKIVEDNIKGRYFSVSQSLITLIQPLGYILSGIVSEWIGLVNTMVISAICFFIACLYVLTSKAFNIKPVASSVNADEIR